MSNVLTAWMDKKVKTVNSIPYNIDGISVYKMEQRFKNRMERVCF